MEDDILCVIAMREQIERDFAPRDADPSLVAPWGIIHYGAEYKSGKCDRPD